MIDAWLNNLSCRMVPLVLLMVAVTGCSWSGERSDELYWQETYEDIPSDERMKTSDDADGDDQLERKKKRINETPDLREADAADSDEKDVLTLHRAFALALRNSHALRQESEQIFRTEAREREIIATILPEVNAISTYTRDSDKIPFGNTPKERTELYFQAEQTIFSGEYTPQKNMNEHAQKIEKLELKKRRNQLLFEVASVFFRILQVEQDIQALEASLSSAREFVDVAGARREAGVATEDELLLARARRNEVESTLTGRRFDRKQARARLAELLAADVNDLPEALDTDYRVQQKEPSVPLLVRQAREQNPDVRIAENRIGRARASKNRVRSEYLPDIDATFTHHTDREDAFNRFIDWTVGLRAEWTLFDGGGREARMAKSFSRIREAKLAKKELFDRMHREIREATLAYRSLDRTLNLFRNRMENARQAAEVVSGRYQAGAARNLEVLRAEETAEEATRNYQRARLARRLAALRIHFAAGNIQENDMVSRIFR
jgi:outer membrane protein TolC